MALDNDPNLSRPLMQTFEKKQKTSVLTRQILCPAEPGPLLSTLPPPTPLPPPTLAPPLIPPNAGDALDAAFSVSAASKVMACRRRRVRSIGEEGWGVPESTLFAPLPAVGSVCTCQESQHEESKKNKIKKVRITRANIAPATKPGHESKKERQEQRGYLRRNHLRTNQKTTHQYRGCSPDIWILENNYSTCPYICYTCRLSEFALGVIFSAAGG